MDNDYIIFNNEPPKTKRFTRRQMIIFLTTICAILIICVTIIVIQHISSNFSSNVVNVSNYDTLGASFPADTKESLNTTLSSLLSKHFTLPTESNSVQATIRPESVKKENRGDATNWNFLLDVDTYQQSYNVSLHWSNSSILTDDVMIECVPKDESAYPNTICYGQYYDSTSPYLYLPYEGRLSSGQKYTAEYGFKSSSGREVVLITLENCTTDNAKENAIKNYLQTTGGLKLS